MSTPEPIPPPATQWVKSHIVWLVGLGAFIIGVVFGHFLH